MRVRKRAKGQRTECVLDVGRSFDPETQEWVYDYFCESKDHRGIPKCPSERELFRIKRGG